MTIPAEAIESEINARVLQHSRILLGALMVAAGLLYLALILTQNVFLYQVMRAL